MKARTEKTPAQQTEARRKTRLANEYRRRGYAVERDVPMGDGLRADVIAKKDDQTIVVAVKSWGSLYNDEGLTSELARKVAAMPDMRFDLVMTAPRKKQRPRR